MRFMRRTVSAVTIVFSSFFLSGCVEIVRVRHPYYGSVRAASGYRVSGNLLGVIPIDGVVRGGFTAGGPPIRGSVCGYGANSKRGLRYGCRKVRR